MHVVHLEVHQTRPFISLLQSGNITLSTYRRIGNDPQSEQVLKQRHVHETAALERVKPWGGGLWSGKFNLYLSRDIFETLLLSCYAWIGHGSDLDV